VRDLRAAVKDLCAHIEAEPDSASPNEGLTEPPDRLLRPPAAGRRPC
jgi:hypothetical protein